jgi:tetratricopeptide (TPR) repeat protein
MIWIMLIFLALFCIYTNHQHRQSTNEEIIRRVAEQDLETLNRMATKTPKRMHAWLWIKRADLLEKSNRPEKALANYDEALKYYPKHSQLLHERGLLLARLGQFKAALADYQKVSDFRFNRLENLHTRGDALLELGRYEEALACLQEALEYKPYNSDHFWADIGYALFQLGRYLESSDALKRSLKIKDSEYALYWYGQALIAAEQKEEALQVYRLATAKFPQDEYLWSEKINLLSQFGKDEEILIECDRFLKFCPNHTDVRCFKALLLFREQKYSSALELLTPIPIKELSIQQQMMRVVLQMNAQQYQRVLEDCQGILHQNPKHRAALEYFAQALEAQGNDAEALTKYQTLLSCYPDAYWVRVRVGLLLDKLHRHGEALTAFETVLQQRPEDTDVLYLKALTLLDLGNSAQALATVQQLLELNPDHQGAIALQSTQTAIALEA